MTALSKGDHMGSFAFTCAVSGFPIEAGDEVRILLLTKNPYTDGEGIVCETHGLWFPRTFPLRATYNDYGSVEDVESGPSRDVWLEGLAIDLIERGVGENTVHDVATRKGMSFPELLNALREGRVLVCRDLGRHERASATEEKGVPTFVGIEKILTLNTMPLSSGIGQEGFLVDELSYGVVRVRWMGAGTMYQKCEEQLSLLLPFLGEYVTSLVAGQNAGEVELHMDVKPCTKNFYRLRSLDDKPPLLVVPAMIREDVWQALLKMKGYDGHTFADVMVMVETQEGFSFKNSIPFTVGLGTNIELMYKKGALTDEFARVIAEMAHVQNVLAMARFCWRPSTSAGPQFGEWSAHVTLYQGLLKVARTREREQIEERKSWEDDG